MADYMYLLENRLSPGQRSAVRTVADLARARGLTVFLVGGAVRDLTSGSPVRDLEIVVQGETTELRIDLTASGASITGEVPGGHAFFVRFPDGARAEIGSTVSITYPKPGKPVQQPATILEDLRRRDFTADAMALSLNPGSYGLLMDPLNGVADIENRQLRLVSNYGFIEAPERMIRAARLMARLGWTLDERTEARYRTGKDEGYIAALSDFARGYETEEIVHEDDALRVLGRLETEGWMAHLAPFWTTAKANTVEFERLHEISRQLEMHGIRADMSAASFPLLTAKLSAKEVAELKASFPRQGFVAEIDALEGQAKELGAQLTSKSSSLPSQTWKLLHGARPEAVLWLAFSSKSSAVQAKLKSFQGEWPQARQKIPYALLGEMRILPELPIYDELLEKLAFELMDGRLGTPEEMRAFLEPYSPPAPPPPVSARKLRAVKKDAKPGRARAKKAPAEDDAELEAVVEGTLDALTAPPAGSTETEFITPKAAEPEPAAKAEPNAKRSVSVKPAPSAAAKAEPPVSDKTPARPPAKEPARPSKASGSLVKAALAEPKIAPRVPQKAAPAKARKTAAKGPAAHKAESKPAPSAAKKVGKGAFPVPVKKTASRVPARPARQVAAAPAKKASAKALPLKKAVTPAKKAVLAAGKVAKNVPAKAPSKQPAKAAKAVPVKTSKKAAKSPAQKIAAKGARTRR